MPRCRGRRVGRELDLGHVPVMHGEDIGQKAAETSHEVVGASDDAASRVRGVDQDVVGEHLTHGVPVLGVHRAEVAGLELLDGLDVVHAFVISGQGSQ